MKVDGEFLKEETQVTKKLFLEESTSLVTREMEIETTLRFPLPQSEYLRSREPMTEMQGWGKKEHLLAVCGSAS